MAKAWCNRKLPQQCLSAMLRGRAARDAGAVCDADGASWGRVMCCVQGPMTDDDVSVWMGQRAFWDVADDLFRLAVNPFVISGFMGCSMEYCVRLLRSLRFAYVVSMPR